MAEDTCGRSLYGQFGRSNYSQTAKKWSFVRKVGRDDILEPISHAVTVTAAQSKRHELDHRDGKEGQMRRLEKQSKALVQFHPHLQPASSLLPELARVSEGTIEAAEQHDPMQGNLLAFGTIPFRSAEGSAKVISFPSGLTGSDLRIMELSQSPSGGREFENLSEGVQSVSGPEATWKGPGAPIQSISFARPTDATNVLLAVRMCREIIIFQPMLDKRSKKHRSKLDLDPIARVGIDHGRGVPHADVAFNPWGSRQFAMVDQAGHWSVRELQLGDRWTISDGLHSGSLEDFSTLDKMSQTEDIRRPHLKPLDDGWARVAWVFSANLLAICNRRRVIVLNFENQTKYALNKMTAVLEDGICWYLDLVVAGPLYNYLLILTTSHIMVYDVACDDDDRPTMKSLTCIKHFRNPNDISLRLETSYEDNIMLIFLRSDLCSVVIYYHVNFAHREKLVVSDPFELVLARAEEQTTSDAKITSVHVQCVLSGTDNHRGPIDSAVRALPRGRKFYSVLTLHKDLSVMQKLYASRASRRSEIESRGVELGNKLDLENDNERSGRMADETHQGKARTSVRPSNDRTTSFENTYRDLSNDLLLDSHSVNGAVSIVQSRIRDMGIDNRVAGQTSSELARCEVTVDNAEEAHAALGELQGTQVSAEHTEASADDPLIPSKRVVLGQVEWPSTLSSPYPEGLRSFSSVHNAISENWVSPMSITIPESIRITEEQLALHIAAEMTMASSVVRFETIAKEMTSQGKIKREPFELPLHPPGTPHTPRSARSYFDALSQPQSPALPTPSRSATPSVFTTSSQASNAPASEIARLSRYTSFSKPAPTSLPRNLGRVLTHWTLGSDPATYDWQTSSRHVTRQEEDEGVADLTEKERQRQQRRNERYARRQERQREESQRLQMLSQAPVFTESQPTQRQGGFDLSQATAGSQMATSQIVRGRHGGRPPKKKRKAGF